MKKVRLALLLAVVLAASGARAVQPDEIMPDPRLAARARQLSAELRVQTPLPGFGIK